MYSKGGGGLLRKIGSSIIELVVVIALVVLMGSFGTMKINGRAEKNAMLVVRSKVSEFMRVTAQRAFEEGNEYRIVINTVNNVLTRKDSDGNEKESFFLPDVLEYKLGNGSDTEYEIKIDDIGHGTLVGFGALNRNLFVFNSKGEALYKINMRDNTKVGYIKFTTYIPEDDMDESNYLTGSWEKE
jgi:hypothetical protein